MKKIYIIGLMSALLCSSCSNFLEKDPSTSLPVESAVTTMKDLRNAVNGIAYIALNGRMCYDADFAIYADLKGEDFKAVSNNNHAGPISRYQITQTDGLAYNGYYYFYKAIANVNKVLSTIESIPYTDSETAEYNDYKGQLYAWRAMLHFDLARLYCNAPTASADVNAPNSGIVLSTELYDASYVGARATLKATYDQILEDFEAALPLLKKEESNGYINYWAALALRARVNLYNGDNAAALADAQAVITGSPYKLYTIEDYTKVWIQEFTSESILEFKITTTNNAQRNSVGYYCDSEGYGECAFVEDAPLYTYLVANPDDIRSKLIKDQTSGSESGYYPAKYPGREGNMYVNNPKIIRLSDVYLIAAEAAVKTGGDAASYINTLRKNRITGYEDVTSVTLEDILFERRVELFAENSMAFDYWRNKMSVKNPYVGEVKYNDYRTILPIPLDELNLGDALVQNPGY